MGKVTDIWFGEYGNVRVIPKENEKIETPGHRGHQQIQWGLQRTGCPAPAACSAQTSALSQVPVEAGEANVQGHPYLQILRPAQATREHFLEPRQQPSVLLGVCHKCSVDIKEWL